jgi:hypothetical protein
MLHAGGPDLRVEPSGTCTNARRIALRNREIRVSQLGPAMAHFQQALLLNPRHRGAHEHLGELFLALNEPAQAEEHLAALKQICLIPCEEFGSLQQAIAADSSSSTR